MKHFPYIIVVILNFLLAGCASTNENTHLHCTQYGDRSVSIPYCCKEKDGYCQQTCYRYEMRNTCINWECDKGFIKKEIKKEDLKWWQLAGASECVPE